MKRFILPLILVLAIVLTACSTANPTIEKTLQQPIDQSQAQPAPTSTEQSAAPQTASEDLTRVDQQGAIMVEVNPLNLETPAAKNLEFDVALETHSVDLSMDLATLSTLTTDTGLTVQATLWDAPRGGHHVSGKLIFPATKDGKSILEGASMLTLTILNVDAPARVFEWDLK